MVLPAYFPSFCIFLFAVKNTILKAFMFEKIYLSNPICPIVYLPNKYPDHIFGDRRGDGDSDRMSEGEQTRRGDSGDETW